VIIALVIVSLGFAALLAYVLFGQPHPVAAAPSPTQSAGAQDNAAAAELDKKRRELDDHKSQLQDLRSELKQTKKKLFDQRESDKSGEDLLKARADVERSASQQLEVVRSELAHALAELRKLQADQDPKKKRGENPATPSPVVAAAAPPAPAEKDRKPRQLRELSDADRERMERLEHQANKDRSKAAELDKEVKRLKGRSETQNRIYMVTKGELDLVKDKFKALEKRLNRTLLERDLVRRAIKDLERKTGTNAERTELTSEEIAASDQKVEERIKQETSEAERRAALATAAAEAAPAAAGSEASENSNATEASSSAEASNASEAPLEAGQVPANPEAPASAPGPQA
jgi:hypothetical protein